MLERSIRISIYACLASAPFSVTISQAALAVGAALLVTKLLISRDLTPLKSPFNKFILIYLTIQLLALLFSYRISNSLVEFIQNDWLILAYFLVIYSLKADDHLSKAVNILIISSSIMAVYGIYQHFTGVDLIHGETLTRRGNFFRAAGNFKLCLTYGGFQMAVLGLVLGLGMHLKSGKSKYLYLSSSVVILASLIASYARSAWLGFIAMTFFGGLIKGKKYVLYVIAGLILVGAFLFVFHPALIYQHGLLSMIDISENMPYNNLVRIKLWGTALKIVADYPILGVGQGNFTYFIEKYKIPFNYRGIRSLHSDPLTFAVNSGVL
ncbi:MAG: O-antigen ligase family protein, partial [Fidelibacterota bacterium]